MSKRKSVVRRILSGAASKLFRLGAPSRGDPDPPPRSPPVKRKPLYASISDTEREFVEVALGAFSRVFETNPSEMQEWQVDAMREVFANLIAFGSMGGVIDGVECEKGDGDLMVKKANQARQRLWASMTPRDVDGIPVHREKHSH